MNKGNLPTGPLRQVIGMNAETYTVLRYTTSTNEIGDVEQSGSTHETDIYVFQPEKSPTQLLHGESIEASLVGLALPNADLQDDDVIIYGDEGYEMTVTKVPNETSPQFLQLEFEQSEIAIDDGYGVMGFGELGYGDSG